MFKKTLLALAVAGFSGAAFAGASSVTAAGSGVDEKGVIAGTTGVNDKAIIVSLEGVQAETILDLSQGGQADTLTFTIGDVASILAQYPSFEKLRVTLTGADFNPATSVVGVFQDVDAGGGSAEAGDLDATVKFTASNVVELTPASATAITSVVTAGDEFRVSGFALSNFAKSHGATVTAKVEVVSNVGSQVIDTDTANYSTVLSTVGTYISSSTGRFNATIDVTTDRKKFTGNTVADTLTIATYADKSDIYKPTVTGALPVHTVYGDFSWLDADGDGKVDTDVSLTATNSSVVTPAADFSSVVIKQNATSTLDNSAFKQETIALTVETDGTRVLPVGGYSADVTYNYNDHSANARVYTRTGMNAGAWGLNGSNINVPYLPVGYETLSSNIEISNDSTVDGEISLTAFDQNGNKYDTVKLTNVAKAKTVTKISEADLVAAFGLTAGTKLSLDITVNAPTGITVYPYYRENDVRVSLPTSQYRATKCTASGDITTQARNTTVSDTTTATTAATWGNTSGSVSTSCTQDFSL